MGTCESEASRCAGGARRRRARTGAVENRWCTRRARDAISERWRWRCVKTDRWSAGCGKSAVLEEVAHVTGNGDFVTLHLDAQTDSKSLLGAYVCGAAPGEFKWQPGALTQAVTKGVWVLIEDIDLAPFEVLTDVHALEAARVMRSRVEARAFRRRRVFNSSGPSRRTRDDRALPAPILSRDCGRASSSNRRGGRAAAYPVRVVSQISRAHAAHARDRASGSTHVRSRWRRLGGIRGSRSFDGTRLRHTRGHELFDGSRTRRVGTRAQANDANHTLSRVHAGAFTLLNLLRWARRIVAFARTKVALCVRTSASAAARGGGRRRSRSRRSRGHVTRGSRPPTRAQDDRRHLGASIRRDRGRDGSITQADDSRGSSIDHHRPVRASRRWQECERRQVV